MPKHIAGTFLAEAKNLNPGNPLAKASFRYQQRFSSGIVGKVVRRIPRPLLRKAKCVFLLPLDVIDFISGRRREMVPPRILSFEGDGDFEATGDEFLQYFIELGNLTPDADVLEIGCGIGRMARPLTRYLTSGTYEGIDIVPKGIRWCQRNITARYPNFRFQLADVHNSMYNPDGRYRPAEYRFPFADESLDFVYLTSVFTHMLASEMEHYVSEIRRTLRTNARCLITYFLLNGTAREQIRAGRSSLTFRNAHKGCWLENDRLPEHAVAYDEGRISSLFCQYGLTLETIRYGGWSGRVDYLSYQDVVIARKN